MFPSSCNDNADLRTLPTSEHNPPPAFVSTKAKPPKGGLSSFPPEAKGKELLEFMTPVLSNDEKPAALPSLLAAYHPWSFSSFTSEMSDGVVTKIIKKQGTEEQESNELEVGIEKKSRKVRKRGLDEQESDEGEIGLQKKSRNAHL